MDFLVIDDDKTFRDATCLLIEDEGHHAESAATGEIGLQTLKDDEFDAVLLDLNLGDENGLDVLQQLVKSTPDLPVVMFTAQGNVASAVEAMRRGALDFLEKPFTTEQFRMVLARVQRFNKMNQNIERLQQRVKETTAQNPELLLDFATPAMRQVMEILKRAAATPVSILISGESGTGKSVVARAIHEQSQLADKPFVTVSCPSLSKELLESELFGHVRGAFTGAVRDHWGKVRAAAGGTLFLDEIGDLPLEIQPKLLRLLQEREYERLGENVVHHAEVRVIAATNRDLKKRMSEGAFREDLYFRLNVIAVEMPPLRSCHDDLLRFAQHYLKYFAAHGGHAVQGFSDDAVGRVIAYPWPGNLRELRNAIERAVILAKSNKISVDDLPMDLRPTSANANALPQVGELIPLEKIEEMHVRRVLERTSSVAEAARVLGIDDATIYRKRKKMGIE
jgi:NtrC-family two-component system response regulator AlgB